MITLEKSIDELLRRGIITPQTASEYNIDLNR